MNKTHDVPENIILKRSLCSYGDTMINLKSWKQKRKEKAGELSRSRSEQVSVTTADHLDKKQHTLRIRLLYSYYAS